MVGGSRSDFPVLEQACAVLMELGVPSELRVVSAHRTPDHLFRYAEEAPGRGIRVIVAGAGGAAHLPGMLAAKTSLPVIGVPIPTQHLGGMDSLLSIVQMPRGIPVATVAIGNATNAGLLAAQILALADEALASGWPPGARRSPRPSWTTPRTRNADVGAGLGVPGRALGLLATSRRRGDGHGPLPRHHARSRARTAARARQARRAGRRRRRSAGRRPRRSGRRPRRRPRRPALPSSTPRTRMPSRSGSPTERRSRRATWFGRDRDAQARALRRLAPTQRIDPGPSAASAGSAR